MSSPTLSAGDDLGRQSTPVLYIVGLGRSGSTLLANILGSADGFVSVGELHEIWQRGFLLNQPCGCGARFLDCPFWLKVREHVEAAHGPIDVASVRSSQLAAARMRHLPRFFLMGSNERGAELRRYVRIMSSLYRGISETHGGSIVVDASKYPVGAEVLRLTPGVDAGFLHLVRDPRAVARSWQRGKVRGDVLDMTEMKRFSPATSAGKWVFTNLVAELLARTGRYTRLRYEDFVADPSGQLARVLTELRMLAPLPIAGRNVTLQVCHTIDGNPDRRRTGNVSIQLDDEWRGGLARTHRLVVESISGLLMLRYDYGPRTR